MADQEIINLRKKLDALSLSKIPQDKPKEEVKQIIKPNPVTPNPLPKFQEKKNILDDLTPEQIRELKEKLFPQEVPQEIEEEEEVDNEEVLEEPSAEDLEQFRKIQAEIERLQNTGAFRVEMLYQFLGLNSNLNRIAVSLEKITNGKK